MTLPHVEYNVAIVAPAPGPVQPGRIFFAGGVLRKIIRVSGQDPAAPVIVEEQQAVGAALPGQLSLWARAAVDDNADSGGLSPPSGAPRSTCRGS